MLRAQGVDVVTTLDAGALGQLDHDQLGIAVRMGRVMVTHNRLDFERLHADYLAEGRQHYGIIIAPQRRNLDQTRGRLLELLNSFDADQLRGQLLYG